MLLFTLKSFTHPKLRFVLFFSIVISITANAQEVSSSDSIILLLKQSKTAYAKYGVNDSIRPYAKQAVQIASRINDHKLLVKSFIYMAASFVNAKEIKQSENYYFEALKVAKSNNEDSLSAWIYLNMGELYVNRSLNKEAIEAYIHSSKINKKKNCNELQVNVLLGLSNLYSQMGELDKRIDYLNQCKQLSLKLNKPLKKVNTISLLASHFLGLTKVSPSFADTAILLGTEALPIAKKHQLNSRIASIYITLFYAYSYKKEKAYSQDYSDSIILYRKYIRPNSLILFYINMSEIEKREKNYQFALNYLDSASLLVTNSEKYKDLMNLYAIAKRKHKLFEKLNDFENGYYALLKTYEFKDSILSKEKFKVISELEVKYESQLKQAEIDNLEQMQLVTVKEKKLQQQLINNQYGLIVAIIILALVLVFLVSYWYKQKKQKLDYQVIKIKQKLLRSQLNPHFLFNSLTAIQKSILKDENKIKSITYLGEFSRLMRTVLEGTFKEAISLDSEIDFLNNYVSIQRFRYNEVINLKINVDKEINTYTTLIPPMLLQPLIENSIEHGGGLSKENIRITVGFERIDNKLKVVIEDNGIGLKETSTHQPKHVSRALEIVAERLKLLEYLWKGHSSIKIININDGVNNSSGVKVILMFPFSQVSNKG